MLLPLGSPLPDDSVSAVRGESGMLGGLSVPLTWGVAVPPDDYDHWATDTDEGTNVADQPIPGLISTEPAEGMDEWAEQAQWGEQAEWGEQAQWSAWEGEAEPRFDLPRTSKVVPHSPAAG
ncbi:hypothetical protein [Mycobacterium sp. Marseille-P9652]|uniref:hypothetical protein n=1 Tax=Mycobacterium sp. Marseille-P9652 TaxID=2654950 RepID=UPI001E47ED93|nr:hypothetical protein [Mycobacterium sp. Marseille-P9652]